MLDLSAYSSVLLAHVVSGVWLVGSSLLAPVSRMLALEAPTLPELRAHVMLGHRASKWNPLRRRRRMAHAGRVAVVRPAENALSGAARMTGEWMIPADADVLRASRCWTIGLASMLAADASMLVVMYLKPPLAVTLVIVAAAIAVAIGALLARHHATAKMGTLTISQS